MMMMMMMMIMIMVLTDTYDDEDDDDDNDDDDNDDDDNDDDILKYLKQNNQEMEDIFISCLFFFKYFIIESVYGKILSPTT